jgi:protein-L-isoaspartate O-methyltransferase
MLAETVQEILTTLRDLEQQETLLIEANFVARVYALDVLSFRVLEHIENVQYVHGYHEYLASLYHRAERLWQRLESVNAQLFERLRAQLLAGPDTRSTLHRLRQTYVGHGEHKLTWEDLDADYLDIFINGVLGIASPPEETRTLEPGMIAYHPTPTRVIFALMAHAHLDAHDVFYDLGSGLGRVALLAGLLTNAQVRGIEFEPAYCAYAQERAHSLNLSRVTFRNADAREADYTDGTFFFLYTPFTGRVLQAVLARLETEAHTRPITIAAYGACIQDVARQPWLQPTVQQAFEYDTLALFCSG